ncbi:MBL fold metallo-hydrolase [Geminicoccaceae bacterium 1502E]|nr:MBL fold metallo-hydrolase [Geminicoccaceae bacterium 1502E]
MSVEPDFRVRFWGVRGTVACPGESTLRYGGNTACVEICCGGRRLVFDAGTGLRLLGRQLAANGERFQGHLFLTHTHIDHIGGLPFFKPAYMADNCFELWAGHLRQQGRTLQEVLCRMMESPYFPVPLDILHACMAFHDFEAGQRFDLGDGIEIGTAKLNHPGGATGYRVDFAGRSVCYVTDTEHREGELDRRILELIQGSDLVIYDATYTDEEYPRFRGWGHSTWQQGVRLCRAAGARRLAAFHHDPEHDDQFLDGVDEALGKALDGSFVAREGTSILL